MKTQITDQHREAIEAMRTIQSIQLMAGLDSWKESKIAIEQSTLSSLGEQIVREAKEIMGRQDQKTKDLVAEQMKMNINPLSDKQWELGNIYWF